MALVTVQRSPSPSASAETDEGDTGQDTVDSSLRSPRNKSLSENYFTVKGAALILPQSDYEAAYTRKATKSHGGDIQSHLQSMFSLLRPLDTIKVAVKLEGVHDRYLALVSCMGKQDTEESVILGMDLRQGTTTIGLIKPVWAHTHIQLDGDGGFSITSNKETHFFKPVSVQAMWSALQSLNKVVKIANDKLYIPVGLTHTWVGFYEAKKSKDYQIVSEWDQTSDIDRSYRTDTTTVKISDEGSIYKRIKTELKLVMMSVDLEEVTCKFLRESLEKTLGTNLREYRSFIDTEMFEILGQMDAPSQIQDYLYLGSEWNASNIEELQKNGVHYILNVSREIDNFYPGVLHYYNVREWDTEQADLLKHWEDTHRYITKARKKNGKVLVHCKMGISRSASTVIAHLMKENRWTRDQAYEFTREKRSIINPNSGFWKQLETYEGILNARRKYIENVNKPVSSGLAPATESEENIDLEAAFPKTAEDLLAMKLGKDPEEFGDYHHLFNAGEDIELSSRSADSTEESFPDERSPQPDDESAQGAIGGSFLHPRKKEKKDKSSSGDYLETDSSDDTESEEMSDSDGDNGSTFRPIDAPKIDIQVTGKGKRQHKHDVKKVEPRRSKSESDKHTLKVSGIPRDGSVSKFRADQSWIKLHQSDEEEAQTIEPMDTGQEQGIITEGVSEGKQNEDEGLWMGEIQSKSEQEAEKWEENKKPVAGNLTDKDSSVGDSNTTVDSKEETGAVIDKEGECFGYKSIADAGKPVKETCAKESVPIATGHVQKQRQDYEGKLKSASGHAKSASLGATDLQILYQSDNVREDSDTAIIMSADLEKGEVHSLVDLKKLESAMEVDQSGDAKSDISDASSTQKTKMRSRLSVYDLEEIDLPEDFVKKTTLEIENRLSVETPRKRLQRSSSLKSKRVTPKAKDRDNERRKTCIAMLSPTSSDSRMREDVRSLEKGDSQASIGKSSTEQSDMKDFSAKPTCDPEGVTIETTDETGQVKVYKYMGEELMVQEGLVKKQTLGIEQKSTGAPTSQPPSRPETEMDHSGRLSESPSVCSGRLLESPSVCGERLSKSPSVYSVTSDQSDKIKTAEIFATNSFSSEVSKDVVAKPTDKGIKSIASDKINETDTSNTLSSQGDSKHAKSGGVVASADTNFKMYTKESEVNQVTKSTGNSKSAAHDKTINDSYSGSRMDTQTCGKHEIQTKDLEFGKEIDCTTPAKSFDSIRANFQDKTEKIETGSVSTPVPAKKLGTRKQTSRFDQETLELIREIGSALMNSPAKTEVEESDSQLESGRGLVKNYVRNIERRVWSSRKKKPTREIIIVDKDSVQEDTKSSGSKHSSVKSLPSQACDVKPEISNVHNPKWSPVSKTPPASGSPVSKKPSSPSSITSSPETVQTHRGSPVEKQRKPDPSNLSLNLEGSPKAEQTEKSDKQPDKSSAPEPCSVKNLVGKFQPPSGKTTPVSMLFGGIGSPSTSFPSAGMVHDIELIEKKDNVITSGQTTSFKPEASKIIPDKPGVRSLSPKAESSKSCHDTVHSESLSPKSVKRRSCSDIPSHSAFTRPCQSPVQSRKIQHRQSEPDIHLSERNIHMLDAKLREMGEGFITSSCIIESEEEEEIDSESKSTVPKFIIRSRSEDQKERMVRMIGAKSKMNLGRTETVSESDSQDTPMFTWEGKKIRKNYGKSHPLTKLEGAYPGSIRSSQFYSTM